MGHKQIYLRNKSLWNLQNNQKLAKLVTRNCKFTLDWQQIEPAASFLDSSNYDASDFTSRPCPCILTLHIPGNHQSLKEQDWWIFYQLTLYHLIFSWGISTIFRLEKHSWILQITTDFTITITKCSLRHLIRVTKALMKWSFGDTKQALAK